MTRTSPPVTENRGNSGVEAVTAGQSSGAADRIRAVYSAERFADAGRIVVGKIAQFLERAQRGEGSVLNWAPPAENQRKATELLTADAEVGALVEAIFSHGQTIQDPRYTGHQVAAPAPLAALFEAVSAISNQGMTIYEMGPWSSAVERTMVAALGGQLGLKPGFGGILTSGGSLANLTALLSARNIASGDIWRHGAAAGGGAGVLLSHGENHYSIERAAGILGLGTANCLQLAVDDRARMDVRDLRARLVRLREEGRKAIAVVAAACSTRTGAFDPIERIADICEEFGVWLHVDAAHGGAAAFSRRHSPALRGIERADSITFDAHKMLFMPALSTYLFYKRGDDQYHAVSQDAPYLFDPVAKANQAYNTGVGTIECTKRAAAFSLWATWATYGPGIFEDMVDSTFAVAREFAARLRQEDDFELLYEPEANIVLFRHWPAQLRHASSSWIGRHQNLLRRHLIESGEAYITPATDKDVGALRMVVMNPLTNEGHLERLLGSIRNSSLEVLQP